MGLLRRRVSRTRPLRMTGEECSAIGPKDQAECRTEANGKAGILHHCHFSALGLGGRRRRHESIADYLYPSCVWQQLLQLLMLLVLLLLLLLLLLMLMQLLLVQLMLLLLSACRRQFRTRSCCWSSDFRGERRRRRRREVVSPESV